MRGRYTHVIHVPQEQSDTAGWQDGGEGGWNTACCRRPERLLWMPGKQRSVSMLCAPHSNATRPLSGSADLSRWLPYWPTDLLQSISLPPAVASCPKGHGGEDMGGTWGAVGRMNGRLPRTPDLTDPRTVRHGLNHVVRPSNWGIRAQRRERPRHRTIEASHRPKKDSERAWAWAWALDSCACCKGKSPVLVQAVSRDSGTSRHAGVTGHGSRAAVPASAARAVGRHGIRCIAHMLV